MSNNVPADKVMYFSPKLHQNNYKNNQVELKTDAKECHYCSHGQGLASSESVCLHPLMTFIFMITMLTPGHGVASH